ncbi:glycosyltransferase [Halococcus morrhuae]
MNISIIATKLNLREGAGSSVSLDTIASGLADRGHNVRIRTINLARPNHVRDSAPYEVTSIMNERDWTYEAPFGLLDEIRSIEPETDLFHVFAPWLVPLFGYYRYLGGDTPVVGRLNGYTMFCTNDKLMNGECHKHCSLSNKINHDNSDLGKKMVKLPKYLYMDLSFPKFGNEVDKLFAQSPTVEKYYSEAGIDADRVTVISNFYNEQFHSGSYSPPSMGDWDGFNLLYVGRIEEEKGVDTLVDSANYLPDDYHIHIAGDGSMLDELKRTVDEEANGSSVTFHGWVDRDALPSFYDNAEVFVHPSRWPEPSGRAVLEALQYDCPIIASDIGGPQWIKGEAGSVFERNNPEDLSSKVLEISSNAEKYDAKVQQCSERLEYFAPDRILNELENEYTALR